MPEKSLVLDAMRFELLGLQRGGAAVYRGDGAYLRVGEKNGIMRDLALHRAMERAKYPVAPILSEGELGNKYYFIEKALGARSFRAIFQEDFESTGQIAEKHVQSMLSVLKKLFGAQLKMVHKEWHVDEFAEGIRLPALCAELPDHAPAIRARFESVVARLKKVPGVLTHGDCNPANIYEDGIIDLEDSFNAPIGYDIVSALMSVEWSPPTHDFEFFAQYRFSEEQKDQFRKIFGAMSKKASLPDIAHYFDDFAFCRAVWLSSGMHAWPRIQQWRFEKLIRDYL